MIRTLARPLLATAFIADGADMLINTEDHVEGATEAIDRTAKLLPNEYARQIPTDKPKLFIRAAGATKVAAGAMYAAGKRPRCAAATLALLQVPTILARHAFWETQDPKEKAHRRSGFVVNVGLLGGLMLGAVDTAGKPGLKWRTEHAAKEAKKSISAALPSGSDSNRAEEWKEQLSERAEGWGKSIREGAETASEAASSSFADVKSYYDDNKDDWADSAKQFAEEASDVASDLTEVATEKARDWFKTLRKKASA